MSDTTPSAKRQRAYETINEATPVRSHIWMPFGDIILQVQSTQFRVSRDVLANQSPVFADMLSVPQPPDEPQVDGCPIVILSGDSAKDWGLLLKILYEPFEDKEKRTFDEIAAMLRLGRKYEIAAAEANAVRRLHLEFPSDLGEWDSSGDYTKIKNYDGMTFDVLNLAHEFGINSSIPTMAYVCLQKEALDRIFNGVERADKSRINILSEVRQTLVVGFGEILKFQHQWYSWLDNERIIPSHSCGSRTACTGERNHLRRFLAWNTYTDSVKCFALDPWQEHWSSSFCDACGEAGERTFTLTRLRAWEALPSFFGLPEWAELKDAV